MNNKYNKYNKKSMIVTPSEFKSKNVTVSQITVNQKTKRSQAQLLYNGVEEFYETRALFSPFVLASYGENNTYSILLSDSGRTANEKKNSSEMFEEFHKVDEYMIKHVGVEQSEKIFKTKYTEEQINIIRALYSPIVKTSSKVGSDGSRYPNGISAKFSTKYIKNAGPDEETEPDVLVFKYGDTTPLQINSWDDLSNSIPAKSYVTLIIRFRPWFINKKFGVSLRVVQVMVDDTHNNGIPTSYAFSTPVINDSVEESKDDSNDSEDGASSIEEICQDTAEKDSDEEDEDEEEYETQLSA